MEGSTKLTTPQLPQDCQGVELPAKVLPPFAQSSLTVRRSSSKLNQLAGKTVETGRQCGSTTQTSVENNNTSKICLLDSSPRQHLGNDHCQEADQHLGLQKSLTVSRLQDGVTQNGGKTKSRVVLPKPSELFSRSRKRMKKAAPAMPKTAHIVEEHITQLQRKKANFYGCKQQENVKPFIPHESFVHVTREQLQLVPSSEDLTKPLSPPPFCWSSDEWLGTPNNQTAATSHGNLQNNFQETSATLGGHELSTTSVYPMELNHLHQSNKEDNQYTFWGFKSVLCRNTNSEE